MSNIDKQALRQAAEKALPAMKRLLMMPNDELFDEALLNVDGDVDAANAFNLLAGPETMLALLDELEAAEKRIAELSKAASINNHWKPDVCPITGRTFFMWIDHETLGYVPTYGGPFDSYTIPTRDSSGEFSCERYDHDFGGWVEGETIGLYLIDDDEQCRVCELEERVAELEARAFNPAILDVIAERQRQQSVEGWTPGHDDEHSKGELAMAAVCYINETGTVNRNGGKPWGWPWDASWWKPKGRRRNLVKASALILAEIERIDRAACINEEAK